MKSRSRSIFEKSVSAIMASIELYNKPDFFNREECFSILAVNAWELLLKARILQLASNSLNSIAQYETLPTKSGKQSKANRKIKNRAGNVQTIGILKAYDLLVSDYSEPLNDSIRKNIEALVEIRDNSVHLINKGLDLERKILEIGTATLNNYIKISRQWFGSDLSQYNIFLMPLAFIREFPKAEGIVLNGEERNITSYFSNLNKGIRKDDENEFNTSLSIEISLKRSKEDSAIKFSLSNDPDAVHVKLEEADIREKYPWSYELLTSNLKQKHGVKFKTNSKYHKIRKDLEKNEKYCMVRLLDPGNAKSSKMKFYNANILKEIERQYFEL
jgi:Protein of unknown function (DUF3644)